jgi:hypothetical protein
MDGEGVYNGGFISKSEEFINGTQTVLFIAYAFIRFDFAMLSYQ